MHFIEANAYKKLVLVHKNKVLSHLDLTFSNETMWTVLISKLFKLMWRGVQPCEVCISRQLHNIYSLFYFICRDDYDKEVKQAKELQRRRHTTTPRRPRRPDIQVYNPRRRRKYDTLFLASGISSSAVTTPRICVLIFRRFWARSQHRRVEREWVKHRNRHSWNWTLLAGLSGWLRQNNILPCSQGWPQT